MASSRQNLATGPLAEYCHRAWVALQLARAYRDLNDAAGLREIEAVLHEKLPTWPATVQVFVCRSLDAIHTGSPQPQEARQ